MMNEVILDSLDDWVIILPLYHKSGLLGLYATLTVSDLFFVFLLNSTAFFEQEKFVCLL